MSTDETSAHLAVGGKLPTVFVIGAPRAGSTSLHHYLGSHPGLSFPSRKELRYFAYLGATPRHSGPGAAQYVRDTVTDLGTYLDAFPPVDDRRRGESCPLYLRSDTARASIADIREARAIAILREPCARALSDFRQMRSLGREPQRSFERVLADEADRIAAGWTPFFAYARKSDYLHDVTQWKHAMGERLLVLEFDQLRRAPAKLMAEVLDFLELPSFEIDIDMHMRHNASGEPADRGWRRFIGSRKGRAVDERAGWESLRKRFSESIDELERVSGLDLEHWRDPKMTDE